MNARGQGGFNLGNAYGEVIIDPQRAIAGLNQAERGILGFGQRVGGAITGLGNQMASLGGDLTTLTAPLLAFGATGVRTASQYEDALKEIEVRAGLTAEQIDAVRERTLQLGRDTEFGPAQAADAFLQLLTSGSSVEEAMLQIDSVLAGASASGSQLGFTADALTDIMASFRMEADESESVMQALIDASGSSSATFDGLVQGFANIGPAARLMGLDVRETAAVLAQFSENGIKGAEAGTQLRSMLNNMTRDSASTQEAWAELGINIFDASGEIRDINDLMQDLNDHMEGMSDQQRIGIIQGLAGSYGQLGLSSLLATDGIDEMLDKMNEGADITEIAASRLETFSGGLSFLRGSVELLQIQALTPLMNEVLRPMVMAVADIVNQINEWIQANPELANQVVRVLTAVTALGPALFIAGKGLSAIGGIITVISSPLGLLVGAIGAIGYAYRENLGGFADFIDDEVLPAIEDIIDIAKDLWKKVEPILEAFAEWFIEDALPAIVEFITDTVVPGIQSFIDILVGIWNEVAPHLLNLANWFLYDALPAIQSFITDTVIPAIQNFIGILVGIWEEVAPHLLNLANWFLQDVIPAIVAIITESIIPAIESFTQFLSDLWGIVQPHLANLARWFLEDALPAIQTFISDTLIPAIQDFIDILVGIWNEVSPHLLDLADWFLNDALPKIQRFIEEDVIPNVQNFIRILGDIWREVQPHLQNLLEWFQTTGIPFIETAINGAITVIQGIIDILVGIWNAVQPFLEDLREGVEAIFGGIVEAIQGAIDKINEFSNIAVQMGPFAGLFNQTQDTITRAQDALNNKKVLPPVDLSNAIPGLAVGTNYVPEDQLAFLHEGEAVIPKAYNPAAGGMGSSGITIGDITIHANSAAEGRAAAQGFAAELDAILERSGLNYSMGAI